MSHLRQPRLWPPIRHDLVYSSKQFGDSNDEARISFTSLTHNSGEAGSELGKINLSVSENDRFGKKWSGKSVSHISDFPSRRDIGPHTPPRELNSVIPDVPFQKPPSIMELKRATGLARQDNSRSRLQPTTLSDHIPNSVVSRNVGSLDNWNMTSSNSFSPGGINLLANHVSMTPVNYNDASFSDNIKSNSSDILSLMSSRNSTLIAAEVNDDPRTETYSKRTSSYNDNSINSHQLTEQREIQFKLGPRTPPLSPSSPSGYGRAESPNIQDSVITQPLPTSPVEAKFQEKKTNEGNEDQWSNIDWDALYKYYFDYYKDYYKDDDPAHQAANSAVQDYYQTLLKQYNKYYNYYMGQVKESSNSEDAGQPKPKTDSQPTRVFDSTSARTESAKEKSKNLPVSTSIKKKKDKIKDERRKEKKSSIKDRSLSPEKVSSESRSRYASSLLEVPERRKGLRSLGFKSGKAKAPTLLPTVGKPQPPPPGEIDWDRLPRYAGPSYKPPIKVRVDNGLPMKSPWTGKKRTTVSVTVNKDNKDNNFSPDLPSTAVLNPWSRVQSGSWFPNNLSNTSQTISTSCPLPQGIPSQFSVPPPSLTSISIPRQGNSSLPQNSGISFLRARHTIMPNNTVLHTNQFTSSNLIFPPRVPVIQSLGFSRGSLNVRGSDIQHNLSTGSSGIRPFPRLPQNDNQRIQVFPFPRPISSLSGQSGTSPAFPARPFPPFSSNNALPFPPISNPVPPGRDVPSDYFRHPPPRFPVPSLSTPFPLRSTLLDSTALTTTTTSTSPFPLSSDILHVGSLRPSFPAPRGTPFSSFNVQTSLGTSSDSISPFRSQLDLRPFNPSSHLIVDRQPSFRPPFHPSKSSPPPGFSTAPMFSCGKPISSFDSLKNKDFPQTSMRTHLSSQSSLSNLLLTSSASSKSSKLRKKESLGDSWEEEEALYGPDSSSSQSEETTTTLDTTVSRKRQWNDNNFVGSLPSPIPSDVPLAEKIAKTTLLRSPMAVHSVQETSNIPFFPPRLPDTGSFRNPCNMLLRGTFQGPPPGSSRDISSSQTRLP